jgi:hypothetical protein
MRGRVSLPGTRGPAAEDRNPTTIQNGALVVLPLEGAAIQGTRQDFILPGAGRHPVDS